MISTLSRQSCIPMVHISANACIHSTLFTLYYNHMWQPLRDVQMYQTLFLFLKIVSKSQIFTNTITTTEGRLPCCTIIKQMPRGKKSRRRTYPNFKMECMWLYRDVDGHRGKVRNTQRDGRREAREGKDSPTYTPEVNPPPPSKTLVSYFSRNVVTVNDFLLQKHVKTALVLGQGVTCNSTARDTQKDSRPKSFILKRRRVRYLLDAQAVAPTHLLMNCSRPDRRSSMKVFSKRPSSPRNGSCLLKAFPGRDGTTIWGCRCPKQVTGKF